MGLGVSLRGVEQRGFFSRKRPAAQLASELATALGAYVTRTEPLLGRLVHVREGMRDGLEVALVPFEETVRMEPLPGGDGGISVSARTSGAGPGYHAFLVKALDEAARACRLSLSEDGEEFLDETGYRSSRDFQALQREMGAWLRGLASLVSEKGPVKRLAVSMPIDTPRPPDFDVLSPMGPWRADWFASVAQETDALRMAVYGERFFPWWNEGLDARTWQQMGTALLWTEVPWTCPVEEDEVEACELAAAFLARARELDPQLPLPEAELAELRALVSAARDVPPSPQGIGLRRRVLVHPLGGGWTLELPGYWHRRLEDEGATHLYSFSGRTLRSTTYSVRGPRDVLPTTPMREASGVLALLSRSEDGLQGFAQRVRDEEEGRSLLLVELHTREALCSLTLAFRDEDGDWAEEVFRAVRPPLG